MFTMIWFISSQNFIGSSFPRSLRVVVVLVAMLFSVDKLHKNRKKTIKKNSSSKRTPFDDENSCNRFYTRTKIMKRQIKDGLSKPFV